MKWFRSKSRELLDCVPKQFKKDYWIFVIKKHRSWLGKLFLAVLLFLLLSPLLVGAVVGAGYWYMFKYEGCILNRGCLTDDNGKPFDLDKLTKPDFKKASYVYADSKEEIGKYFDEIRDPVQLNEIPKLVQDAFIAAEDKRFYEHRGIDIYAIASALVGNTTHEFGWNFWTRSGGASTITQQLARLEYAQSVNDFKNRAHTLNRKIKEARLAIQLEKRYSKKQILERFLNEIWLGHGANGVGAGFQRYWGKNIRKNKPTIREAVVLAALNKNSVLYDPIFDGPIEPKIEKGVSFVAIAKLQEEYEEKLTKEVVRLATAKNRYNYVLEQMKYGGFISQKEYEENLFQKDTNPNTEELAHLKSWKNPGYSYSNRMIKEMLLGQGFSDEDLSHYGGFRIYTTLDTKIQKIASEEFEKHLAILNEDLPLNNHLNGAFVIIEVKTGNILALSGGNNFDESQYNRVMAYRSPGSGIKPFIYATALEKGGYDLFTKACNESFSMRGAKGKKWAPKNFEEKNPRPQDCNRDLAEGVIFSLNLETLNIARKVTMPPIISLMNSFGIWGNPGMVRDSDGDTWFRRPGYQISGGLVPLLPTAIGASDVNLLELANAYTVFYRGGTYLRPTIIKEVRSTYGDEVLYKPKASVEKRVISQDTSDKVLSMMRTVTKVGTSKISMRGIEQQVACKTGTSDGPRDVSIWCGTPEIFIGIRFGHDNYSVIELPEYMKKVSGDSEMLVSGGWVAAFLARHMFDLIYADRPKVDFNPQVEEYTRILTELYQK